MKYLLVIVCALVFSGSVYGANTWTDFRDIDDIYTYTNEDTLYVYLNGVSCPNTKNYFTIDPSQMGNAKQLISMVLAAKLSKTQVNILYDPDVSATYCYFKGLTLRN